MGKFHLDILVVEYEAALLQTAIDFLMGFIERLRTNGGHSVYKRHVSVNITRINSHRNAPAQSCGFDEHTVYIGTYPIGSRNFHIDSPEKICNSLALCGARAQAFPQSEYKLYYSNGHFLPA